MISRGLPALLFGMIVLALWEGAVRLFHVPVFLLPAPSAIWSAFVGGWPDLMRSAWVTLSITLQAFLAAVVGGVGLAVLFTRSRWAAAALFPYAVVLQVTPVVAIAPLVIIWVGYDRVDLAQLILAWIVAFFPVLGNTVMGLRSVEPHLRDMMRLYGASSGQMLWRLELPSALPFILSGMRISGGLALIGAVVAEFVAGSGTASGLAWRTVEAGNRLNTARMFAALALLSILGVALFGALSGLQRLILGRWHASERSAIN